MVEEFPPAVKAFIAANVRSVADLEVILLLREHRECQWTAAAVGQKLSTNRDMAAMQLSKFRDRSLFVSNSDPIEEAFVFQPAPNLESIIDELARLYREKPVRIIAEIYAEPMNNVRTFADSFRLRKDR